MQNLSVSRILVPIDFSLRSEEAARYAKRLALHFHSEVILLHVVQPVHLDFAMVEPFRASIEDLSKAQLARSEKQLAALACPEFNDVSLRLMVVEGDPADRIIHCAQTEAVNLVVMPTQGHSRIRQFLIGSVTAKVLHDCESPVLTGSHLEQRSDFPNLTAKKILCAVDFGHQSETVLKWGARLAHEFGAKVTVVHADNHPEYELTDRLVNMAKAAGVEAEPLVEAGEPYKAVTGAATRLGADLLIIGRGSTNSTIGRLRAQAYGIVRQSPCPVLSV
jgi:nucleotide-binding universal stress UspA family protein